MKWSVESVAHGKVQSAIHRYINPEHTDREYTVKWRLVRKGIALRGWGRQ